MIGPWGIGLAVALAIVIGYALWRLVVAVRFRRRRHPRAAGPAQPETMTAAGLIKRAEAAVSRLREQTDAPHDPVLRAQIGDVDDHAAEVLSGLRGFAEQIKALDQSLRQIPVERLRHDLESARQQRDEAGDDALRAELDRSVQALEQQLAVADRLDTARRTLLARIEGAVFDLEGLSVRVTELIVMHDSVGSADTEARLSELTDDLEGMRAGLAEVHGLSESILGHASTAPAAAAPPAPAAPPASAASAAKRWTGRAQAAAENKPGRARWDLVTLAVVVVVGLSCVADKFIPHNFTSTAQPAGDDCAYTVAFLAELTGDNVGDGPDELDAVNLAVAQDNAAHSADCQVRVQRYDTAVTGDIADSAAAIAADKSILAVIGPTYGSETVTALPVLQAGGVAVISPSASESDLTTKGWTVFHRTLPSDADQAVAGARYLRDSLKARHVFVVDDKTDYGKDVAANAIKTLGRGVAGHASVADDTTDWRPVVNQIKRSGAGGVYFGGWSADTASFVQTLHAVLPDVPLMTGDKVITESFRTSAGNSGHGTYATCPCVPTTKGLDVFRSQFTARYGKSTNFYEPEAYDAAQIAVAGLRTGVTSRAAMLAFVNGWDTDGLGRHVKFGAGGDLAVDNLNVWVYRSGSDGYFAGLTAIG